MVFYSVGKFSGQWTILCLARLCLITQNYARLVNKIRPGLIKNVGQKDLSFVKVKETNNILQIKPMLMELLQMDNIVKFLYAARQVQESRDQFRSR